MGGTGNEPHFTNEYLSLDVRWLQRQRVLAPGRGFKLQSARDGDLLATVEVPAAGPDPPPSGARRRMEGEALRGAAGLDTLQLWWQRAWFRCRVASGAWRSCTAGRSSPVGSATDWPTGASGRKLTSAWTGRRRRFGHGWGGSGEASVSAGAASRRGCTGVRLRGWWPRMTGLSTKPRAGLGGCEIRAAVCTARRGCGL
jgi:hypothetical protein